MKKPKFKAGDIIKISDINDPSYEYNNLYDVVYVLSDGYVIRSHRYGELRFPDEVDINKFPGGPFKTHKDFMESSYRLATEHELKQGLKEY